MSNKFSFFAPAYLAKSGSAKTTPRVGGIISTERKDADGETILTKGLELDYFTGGFGKIKYEHDNELSKEPENIIGFPDVAIKKSNGLHFEGDLIPFEGIPDDQLTPQAKTSKAAHGLLKAIEQWNKEHPDKPQKVGWSIEGEYLKRSNGTVHKARITNVVLTTKPKNTGTFATIIKSLEVGYAMSPETKSGFGATATESIETSTKNNFTKGDNNMFKSKEEAYKAYLSQGMSEEEAKEKASQWKPEAAEAPAGPAEEAFKSLANSKTAFQKAIDTAKEGGDLKIQSSNEMKKSLDASIEKMKKGEDAVDISEYFADKQNADLQLHQNQEVLDQKLDLLSKSIVAIAEGLNALATGNESFNKSINTLSQAGKLTAQGIGMLIKGKASQSNLLTDGLAAYAYEDNNKADKQLSKGQKVEVLDKLYSEGKINSNVVMGFEASGYLDAQFEPMVKAKAAEMFK